MADDLPDKVAASVHRAVELCVLASVLDGEVTSLVQGDMPLELTLGVDVVLFLVALGGHKYLCVSAGSWSWMLLTK